MHLELSPGFVRRFKQRANRRIWKLYRERSAVFQKNPYDPSLRTHPLKHDWEGHWSFGLTDDEGKDDYRVIYRKTKKGVVFVDFGTHDQLYRPWKRGTS